MQLLTIVFVYIHFLIATEGLECWSCNDNEPSSVCTVPKITYCGEEDPIYGKQFCATASYNMENENCSGNCTEKSCITLQLENKCLTSETFEHTNPDGISAKVSCCQGDLCNGSVEDSKSSVKLSGQNVLICAIVLIINLFILFVN